MNNFIHENSPSGLVQIGLQQLHIVLRIICHDVAPLKCVLAMTDATLPKLVSVHLSAYLSVLCSRMGDVLFLISM